MYGKHRQGLGVGRASGMELASGKESRAAHKPLRAQRVMHKATFFLLSGLCCYYLLALGSFSPLDPSLVAVGVGAIATLHNLGGLLGAQVSGAMLYYLGFVGFMLPPALLYLYVCRRRIVILLFIAQLLLCLLYALEVYAPASAWFGIEMPTAGVVGQELAAQVNATLGIVGGHIVVLTLLGYLLLLVAHADLLARAGKVVAKLPRRRVMVSRPRPAQATAAPQELFRVSNAQKTPDCEAEHRQTAALIKKTLLDFKIGGEILSWHTTPVVTVYEFQPQPGIRQAQITALAGDLALALRVSAIIILPLAGRKALGIQIPNQQRRTVYLGDVLSSPAFQENKSPLNFALGRDTNGEAVCCDLQTMPHLLIAGSTGSGKSVAINSLLCSILSRSSAAQVKLLLVDPKLLELSAYDGIPHLLQPVITDVEQTRKALQMVGEEMHRRYALLKKFNVRNIEAFHHKWAQLPRAEKNHLRQEYGDMLKHEQLPYLVVVIDELADLMLTAPREIEQCIQSIAQKARASGIHLVLATQRPSVDVITGVIKANLPSRVAFRVTSRHDSRTILDIMGAEKLLGKGDMLFQCPGMVRPQRIQGTLVSDEEVQNLVAVLRSRS